MHQHPRSSPPKVSSVPPLNTNPTRTNNMREGTTDPVSKINNPKACSSVRNEEDIASGTTSVLNGPSKDALKKLDQIIQNFHTKAAILVLQSRVSLPPIITQEGTKKINKWFQIETDDTNSFRQELSVWRHCGGYSDRPPPLIIETYIDFSGLTNSQRLVIEDDSGKIWDAHKAINIYDEGDTLSSRRKREIILERWRFQLRDLPREAVYDFGSTLPTVYKKFIVFFRSLFATTKFVPAGRLVRNLAKNVFTGGSLKINCRVLNGRSPSKTFDALTYPIFENGNIPVTNDFVLGTTETPVGQIYAEVSYRQDCDFYIHDNEALLSSRFMGSEEYLISPSLGYKDPDSRAHQKSTEIQSIFSNQQRLFSQNPSQKSERLSINLKDASSPSSSPIYAQRVLKNPISEIDSSPVEGSVKSRPLQFSRNSVCSMDGNTARRPSISFQPFKAGSLSSSPSYTKPTQRVEATTPISSQSSPRASGLSSLVQVRKQSSLTAGTPATLRGSPVASEQGTNLPASSSPIPASTSRYSSSFNRRRSQVVSSVSGRSVVDDDQSSSGKQSLSSSVQPGSAMIHETGIGGVAGSLQSDDDNISEFLKVLERQKTLKSFETSNETAVKRTSAQLSKYESLRESHNALTESMSSSTL
ncbi:Autophagy-related protein 13 [Golovinomyces cichoracearum]|uniref:Autophagy-related protein 13 n=1 Tax=Golovinomyces cichoracearum TaxID=62708 RepID=A0A420IUW1_9PEZI|nr:Autophagy-related protein 13 [Golovinomyces cichoracearum]